MKKLDKKGFSLVELIIVIAIMLVLVGILAPTYFGQVKKSKIGTDLQNAQEIATSIAIKATTNDSLAKQTSWTTIKFSASGVTDNITDLTAPEIKAASGYTWVYQFDGTNVKVGVKKDSDEQELYPTAPTATTSPWYSK